MDQIGKILSEVFSLKALLTTVLTGFISAIFIFIALRIFRPRIAVSNQLAKHIHRSRGTKVFSVKIRNRSILPLINLEVEANLITATKHNGGCLMDVKPLVFNMSAFHRLQGWRPWDSDGKYALRMSILDDLDELWESNSQHIEVTISARHPWSGLTRWFSIVYHRTDDVIVEGEFETQRSMRILRKPFRSMGPTPVAVTDETLAKN